MRTYDEFFLLMRRITIGCARTWPWAKTRRWVGRSSDLVSLSPSQSYPACTTITFGYNFRKGQREMAGATQGGCAAHSASGNLARFRHNRRGRQFGAIQSVAPLWGMEVSPVNVHDVDEIERAVTAFAR